MRKPRNNSAAFSSLRHMRFKACVEHGVLLALGHAFAFAFVEVSQTDVFHCSSPLGGSQQHSLARWIVHPIVVAHRKNRQQRRTIFISIPRAASRENGAPVSAAPGVSRFYSNLQDTRGLPNAAQVIQGYANCGLGCGLKMTSP
jgi:hypothetical protein